MDHLKISAVHIALFVTFTVKAPTESCLICVTQEANSANCLVLSHMFFTVFFHLSSPPRTHTHTLSSGGVFAQWSDEIGVFKITYHDLYHRI